MSLATVDACYTVFRWLGPRNSTYEDIGSFGVSKDTYPHTPNMVIWANTGINALGKT